MRSLTYLACVLLVMGLAFWAYRENYTTQSAIDQTERLQRQIGEARQRLAVLNAEWAYLNRPERLRDLADLNFDRLGLLPFSAEQFGTLADIPMPEDRRDIVLSGITETSSAGGEP